jgi:hypothetical protein
LAPVDGEHLIDSDVACWVECVVDPTVSKVFGAIIFNNNHRFCGRFRRLPSNAYTTSCNLSNKEHAAGIHAVALRALAASSVVANLMMA